MGLRLVRAASILGLAALALAVLDGCGQRGPLYVPGVPAGAAWPHPAVKAAVPAPEKTPDVPARSDPAAPESR